MIKAIIILLRVFLGGIMLWAGLSKVGAPLQTLAAVYSYQIVLPDWLANAVAYVLPWIEIVLGLALILGLAMPITLSATAVVLLVFTALTAQAWWRELPIDCGCIDLSVLHPAFAVLTTPGGATLRNLVFLGATGVLAVLALRIRKTAPAPSA
jgi:uncharacterized membrane protein YphA (DoxX/SURF4 family)